MNPAAAAMLSGFLGFLGGCFLVYSHMNAGDDVGLGLAGIMLVVMAGGCIISQMDE